MIKSGQCALLDVKRVGSDGSIFSQLAETVICLISLDLCKLTIIEAAFPFRYRPVFKKPWSYLVYTTLSDFLYMIQCCASWLYGARKKSTAGIAAVAIPCSSIMTSRWRKYTMFDRCAPEKGSRRVPALSLMFHVMRFGGFANYSSAEFRAASLNGVSFVVMLVRLAGVNWLSLIRRYWMTLRCCLRRMYAGLKMLVPSNRS